MTENDTNSEDEFKTPRTGIYLFFGKNLLKKVLGMEELIIITLKVADLRRSSQNSESVGKEKMSSLGNKMTSGN